MITDEMIAEAAEELNEAMINSLPDPHECKHQFSKRFEVKMEKLIHCVNHPVRYMILNRVASILLVILIGLTMVTSFSPAARAAVFGWIKQTYESFYSYYFETQVDTETNYRYQIDPLPEGYVEISNAENDGLNVYIYTNEQAVLVFSYAEGSDPSMFYVETEGYVVEEIIVNGNVADLYISKDGSMVNGIIWLDRKAEYIFYISGQFNSEEMKFLAESVKKCPHLCE